jgi:hypothetical protein
MLKVLCVYDEHIGRLNYNHQSPVGLARYVHVYVYIYMNLRIRIYMYEHITTCKYTYLYTYWETQL